MAARTRLRGLTAASLLCLAPGAGAQVVGAGPSVTPGVAEDYLREAPRITPNSPPSPGVTPRQVTPPRLQATVSVSALVFGQTSMYTPEQLQAIAQPYLKPRMSLAEIQDLAERITERMRADGYLVASAVVPAQKVKEGQVRIDIIEGKLDSLRVSGNQRYSEERIRKYLAPVQSEAAPTSAAMERSLLLLNELPGVTARGTLTPGERSGTTAMDVEIVERRWRAAIGLSNYGSPELGRTRADVSIDANNPLGFGDHANFRAIASEGSLLGLGRLSYDFPITPSWRAYMAAARINYRVAGALAPLELSGNSLTRDASVGYAWIRSRGTSLTWFTGIRDVRTYQQALGQSLGGLRVHTLYTNVTGYTTLGGGVTSGVAAFASNGKGEDAPGLAGRGIRAKLDLDVTHTRAVYGDYEFSQRIAGTISPDALPDTEKFSLGGPDSVRAFPIAQIRGDEGLLSVTELRRRLKVFGTQAYVGVFFDHGWMRLRQPMLPGYRDSLSGAGITAAVMSERFRIRLDYARALGSDIPNDGHRSRVWISGTWFF